MYKLLFWEFDGSFSTLTGELDAIKHNVQYLNTLGGVYWQIVLNSVVVEQSDDITADCFAGHK